MCITYENAPTEEAKSFRKVKTALLGKFSRKKTESETMKEAVNLTYQGEDVNEFFVRACKPYKKASFKERTKQGIIMEAIHSYEGLSHFVLLRNATMFDKVKETCLEYAEHQNVYSLPKQVTRNALGVLDTGTHKRPQGTDEQTLEKMDMLFKKFEDLA